MRILQLINQNGEPIGLYTTERTDDVSTDFQLCFINANEADDEEIESKGDVQSYADELLEKKGITRVFADEVFVDENI